MRCFIDLAGVLTDWTAAAHKAHGLPFGGYSLENYPYPLKLWSWIDTLPVPGVPLSPAEFLAPLGKEFYATLPWMSDGKEILALAGKMIGWENLYILTTPLETLESAEGTLEWVAREIPPLSRRVIITHAKEACASFETMLLDDKDENVDLFDEYGGWGVLVPRIWNRNLMYRRDPLSYIKSCIEGFLNQESGRK